MKLGKYLMIMRFGIWVKLVEWNMSLKLILNLCGTVKQLEFS